jgi:kojibiose phosphorylase
MNPVWLPDFRDRTKLVRIWTGDQALHISADIAYAAHLYWQLSGDDDWMAERGAELILDTARFWGSRAEWNPETGHFEYNQVIGPDENHDNVNNNAYTNRLAQWNLDIGLEILDWLRQHAPQKANQLVNLLDLSGERLAHWREVADKIHLRVEPDGLIEQFTGYFDLKSVNQADYEPRTHSFQEIFGVEGANDYQIIKQPDVVMLIQFAAICTAPKLCRLITSITTHAQT